MRVSRIYSRNTATDTPRVLCAGEKGVKKGAQKEEEIFRFLPTFTTRQQICTIQEEHLL